MFTFILGREFRLSLAEIQSLFPHASFEYANEQFALVSGISEEEIRQEFAYMGGTIKIIKILDEAKDVPGFMTTATRYLGSVDRTNKVPFAVAGYGEKLDNFATGLRIKKFLKSSPDKSFRLVNKEPKNINSAVYKKERLGESETEMNLVKAGKKLYFGVTIAYQDVDAYAARDMNKTRDMGVGMLPPKLAQIMVNLTGNKDQGIGDREGRYFLPSPPKERGWGWDEKGWIYEELNIAWLVKNSPLLPSLRGKSEGWGEQWIYDPFCGLGTVLIEAANMGYGQIFGSDISPEMVQASRKSMADFGAKNNLKIESSIFEADASKIAATIPDSMNIRTTAIVTEGYLGEVLNARTVTTERIREQCRKLARIYDGFFRGLRMAGFHGPIIISFPFWDNRGKDVFFEDILPIMDRYGFVRQELLSEDLPFRATPRGSLLYRRPGQTVGREIYKLQLNPKESLGRRR